MQAPLVSTITPCFRMGKYLPKFLEELPRQTMFERLQVVLDHNEPSPEEIALVKDFQARYPGRLLHVVKPKVVPIGPSMNDCIDAATADIVTIWNVDDLRTPDSIERQYVALRDAPDAGVAYGNFMIVGEFGSPSPQGRDALVREVPQAEHRRSMIAGPFIMFRKALCKQAGMFDEQFRSGADFDLAVRLAFHARFVYVPHMLGYYLDEGLGLSTRPNSTQPVERTVIELRYGIYDKMDFNYLPAASGYTIPSVLRKGEWIPLAQYVSEWPALLHDNAEKWLGKGLALHVARTTRQRACRRGKAAARKIFGERLYEAVKGVRRTIKKTFERLSVALKGV